MTTFNVMVDDTVNVTPVVDAVDIKPVGAATRDVVTIAVTGPPGPRGANGTNGASAYQVALDGGFSGTQAEWLASLKGETGDTGPRGEQGIQGIQGEAGSQGIQGIQGEAGVSLDIEGTVATYADLPASPTAGDAYVVAADGKLYFFDGGAFPADGAGVPFRGPQGEQGVKGDQGTQGIQGIQGSQGEQGDPGESAYQAAVDGGFSGSQADWLASLKGAQGDTGPSWSPSYTLLIPTGTTGFGNGLDGRTPAVSCAAGALGGGYLTGWGGPWSLVDVYVAWLEYNGTAGPWVCTAYLKSLADGASAGGKPAVANQITIQAPGTQFGYHETLVASGVALTPNAMATGTVARYGNTTGDTYTGAVGIVGMILKPHVP